jgi:hypothetical protein
MNQLAQSIFIAAVGHGAREYRFDTAAQSATGFTRCARNRIRRKQTLTARCAESARDGAHGIQAFPANRETRNAG